MNAPRREFEITERFMASRARLPRLLAEVEESGLCRHTLYLTPASTVSTGGLQPDKFETDVDPGLESILRLTGESDTGLLLLLCGDSALAVAPPFPIEAPSLSEGAHTAQLMELLERDLLIGVVLLRLGRYAVGVVRGKKLVASKTGSRYVKSRHRAGGSSQRRFERSRERLIRELFDKTCQVARDVFASVKGEIDYLLLGGEQHTLGSFVRRCTHIQGLAPITLRRSLDVDRPSKDALESIHREVWKSRVLVLRRVEGT